MLGHRVILVSLALCTVLAAAGGNCTVFPNKVIGTGNIKGGGSGNADACCASCLKTKKCVAWTLSGNECWLKDNTEVVKSSGCLHPTPCTSGIVFGQPTPPPTPPTPPTPRPTPAPPTPSVPFGYGCQMPNAASYKFCNTSLDLDTRVNDLVQRVEVSEMASQLTARQSSSLGRLGIPAYYWGTNALHSIREANCIADPQGGAARCPTAFPIPPNFAATFNMSLAQDMGRSFGTELRAMYNAGKKDSLDTWSPTININRDPR